MTVATVERSAIVPRAGGPCVLLQYHVERQGAASTERLIVCPSRSRGSHVVSGHGMVNPAGAHISTGLVLAERGVSFGRPEGPKASSRTLPFPAPAPGAAGCASSRR